MAWLWRGWPEKSMGRKISNVLPLVLIIVLGIALIPISTILFVNSVSPPTSSMLAIPNATGEQFMRMTLSRSTNA